MVHGPRKVSEYRRRRQEEVKTKLGAQDEKLFHDGQIALEAVEEIHLSIKASKRMDDHITTAVLDGLVKDMLQPGSRPHAKLIHEKSRRLVMTAKEQLIASSGHEQQPIMPHGVPSPQNRTISKSSTRSQRNSHNARPPVRTSFSSTEDGVSQSQQLSSPDTSHQSLTQDHFGHSNNDISATYSGHVRHGASQQPSPSPSVSDRPDAHRAFPSAEAQGNPLDPSSLNNKGPKRHYSTNDRDIRINTNMVHDTRSSHTIEPKLSLPQQTLKQNAELSSDHLDQDIGSQIQSGLSNPPKTAPSTPLQKEVSREPRVPPERDGKLEEKQLKRPEVSRKAGLQWKEDKKSGIKKPLLGEEYLPELHARDHVSHIDR